MVQMGFSGAFWELQNYKVIRLAEEKGPHKLQLVIWETSPEPQIVVFLSCQCLVTMVTVFKLQLLNY